MSSSFRPQASWTSSKTLRYGAVDYLIKPFEFDRFQTALSDYRRKQKVYQSHRSMTQKELDAELFQKKEAAEKVHLPKGLTKARLNSSGRALSLSVTALLPRKISPSILKSRKSPSGNTLNFWKTYKC